jgi:hypothetical protein
MRLTCLLFVASTLFCWGCGDSVKRTSPPVVEYVVITGAMGTPKANECLRMLIANGIPADSSTSVGFHAVIVPRRDAERAQRLLRESGFGAYLVVPFNPTKESSSGKPE